MKCLHDATTQTVEQPTVDAIILDGAVIVQMLKSRMAQTFEEYFSGQRRKVLRKTRIPSDWKGFLRVDDNKDELFKLLANMVIITVAMVTYLNTGIYVMHK